MKISKKVFVLTSLLFISPLILSNSQEDLSPEKDNVEAYLSVEDQMVFVDGGTFKMGSRDNEADDDETIHDVVLSDFFISKYEVTQKLYFSVMKKNPSYFKKNSLASGESQENRPVESLKWSDAVEFCNKLSTLHGLTPCYTKYTSGQWKCNFKAGGYRLPTEAEWEFAARGGNKSKNYKYSGSNDIWSVAWCGTNSNFRTHEVGKKEANELGLYDMSGNVYEWCWDFYGAYSIMDKYNPYGPSAGKYKITRGGAWGSGGIYQPYCRVSGRRFGDPLGTGDDVGFRIVRSRIKQRDN